MCTSLAETPESAGKLKYFAQICLQIFTSFRQIYDVPRTYEPSDGRPNNYDNLLANILNLSANVRKFYANNSTGWNSRFQHSGLSARLMCTVKNNLAFQHDKLRNPHNFVASA